MTDEFEPEWSFYEADDSDDEQYCADCGIALDNWVWCYICQARLCYECADAHQWDCEREMAIEDELVSGIEGVVIGGFEPDAPSETSQLSGPLTNRGGEESSESLGTG